MTTTVQEVRPLTAQEAHERILDQRQQDIKRALAPGKWWAYGGWCLSGLFLITSYFVFDLSSTYYEWWQNAPFALHWSALLILVLIEVVPASLALMCFSMSHSINIAARQQFVELNLATVVETAIYRYISGSKDDYVQNKGCISLAAALAREENEALAVLAQIEQLLEEMLHYFDAHGGLVRLSEKRSILATANQLITYLVEQKMDEPSPHEVYEEIRILRERLQSLPAVNKMPAE